MRYRRMTMLLFVSSLAAWSCDGSSSRVGESSACERLEVIDGAGGEAPPRAVDQPLEAPDE